jgi:hypothetical protein
LIIWVSFLSVDFGDGLSELGELLFAERKGIVRALIALDLHPRLALVIAEEVELPLDATGSTLFYDASKR